MVMKKSKEIARLKEENAELHEEAQKWHNKYFLLKKIMREALQDYEDKQDGIS